MTVHQRYRGVPPLIRYKWTVPRLAVLFVGLCAAVPGCGPADAQPFQCGVAVETDDDFIRYCHGQHEVCICETNYCAKPDESCEASGYRYVEPPFGSTPEDGEERACVERDPGSWIVPTGRKDACPVRPDASAEAAEGGGL